MAVNRIEIKDFLVFKGDFAVDFCPGVNVFIGENGTGKTSLLKAIYAVQERAGKLNDFNHVAGYFVGAFTSEVGAEIHNSIGKLILFHSDGRAFGFLSENEQDIFMDELSFLDESINDNVGFIHKGEMSEFKSVFIPEKDLLANSKKLPESVEYGELEFTRCEIDLIKKARVAASKPSQPLYEKICALIGGEPQNDGQSFFMKRPNIKRLIPFSMEASGYRKFGLLATLIRNEQIKSGSVLLWDEPENSLNPELIPVLVDILLELSRNGVQIFLATHSEIFANYFSVNKQEDDCLMFYSLYKDGEQIRVNSNDRFDLLTPNKLTEEPVKLYMKELDRGSENA